MSAVKDRLVYVPVGPADILNTLKNIPRTPREAGLLQVKFKRKLNYKNYHKQEYIDPKKIFKTLQHLKQSGHPYYQFYDDYNVYKSRCRDESLGKISMDLNVAKTTVTFIHDKEVQHLLDIEKKARQMMMLFWNMTMMNQKCKKKSTM